MKSAVDVGTFGYPSTASSTVFERVIFPYGLAVLSVAVALGIKLILLHFGFPYPLSTSFLLAIAITFWYAGTGPGILSVLLSFIAFALFVLPTQVDSRIVLPDGSIKPGYMSGATASHIQYFFYFALLALLMSWFSSSRRRAEQSLSKAPEAGAGRFRAERSHGQRNISGFLATTLRRPSPLINYSWKQFIRKIDQPLNRISTE